MITEAAIRAAIKRASVPSETTRTIELKDDGDRGAGRLALIIRQLKKKISNEARITTEWYAVYYRQGKRRMDKLGSYPTMPLVDARKRFRTDFMPAITAGQEPSSAHVRKRHKRDGQGTVRELFQSYIDNLRKQGAVATTLTNVERMLLAEGGKKLSSGRISCSGAAVTLGADRPASDIEPSDIVAHLAEIYDRGAAVQARLVRTYMAAAFNFAMRSTFDYTRKNTATRWNLKTNPVAAVPADESAVRTGERFLSPAEFRAFWQWLIPYAAESSVAPALRLQMATGQRIGEILKLSTASWDRQEQMLIWDTAQTKNGLAHSIPLSKQTIAILETMIPNRHGLYFPSTKVATQAIDYSAAWGACRTYIEKTGAAPFSPRDIRRTWKTLSGRAGISKEWRDRLQNHALGDVASKHYDRYDYLPERRAAVATWEAFLDRILAGEFDDEQAETRAPAGIAA